MHMCAWMLLLPRQYKLCLFTVCMVHFPFKFEFKFSQFQYLFIGSKPADFILLEFEQAKHLYVLHFLNTKRLLLYRKPVKRHVSNIAIRNVTNNYILFGNLNKQKIFFKWISFEFDNRILGIFMSYMNLYAWKSHIFCVILQNETKKISIILFKIIVQNSYFYNRLCRLLKSSFKDNWEISLKSSIELIFKTKKKFFHISS